MSEKSRWSELHEEIFKLDAEFPSRYTPTKCNAVERLRSKRCGFLRGIYKTGQIRRPSLPIRSYRVSLREIPRDVLEALLTNPAPSGKKTFVEIPDDVLLPKRRRGRPRNESLRALAKEQRCSERHARRLLASGKQREPMRERLSSDEAWALQQREKRAALVQALKQEDVLNLIAHMLDILHRDVETVCLSPDISGRARPWAVSMANHSGIDQALLICGFALGNNAVRSASISLGVSRSTICRTVRGKLHRLRSRGAELARALVDVDLDLSQVPDAPVRTGSRRLVTEQGENASSAQTTYQPLTRYRSH